MNRASAGRQRPTEAEGRRHSSSAPAPVEHGPAAVTGSLLAVVPPVPALGPLQRFRRSGPTAGVVQ
ncbi:hypothetical protein [Streptomyces sp. NPDC096105]|uniref:hypothetical protein n=1 Tax=Streptomyces sp. NPDC096105 TaxID=3366074 RepID=UPI0037F8A91C